MARKIAINGFGRIGKQYLLACLEKKKKWEFIINGRSKIEDIIYSLKYDSVHRPPKEKIRHDGKNIIHIGSKKIKVIQEENPEKLPWKEEKVDVVIESTGAFTKREDAEKHIKAGAKKVLISAPSKDADITLVPGINGEKLRKTHKIISVASCTTNCTAPMIKILNDAYGIKSAQFVTTHAYTSDQRVVDGSHKKDPRRGRSAAENIVPTTTGAAQAVIEAIPELQGKIDGYALRVPVVDGSITSLFAYVKKKTDAKKVNALFKKQAVKKYKGILEYTKEPIVSTDIINNPHSCILDSEMTSVIGNLISIAGWYDNEWGYSNRLVDATELILKI